MTTENEFASLSRLEKESDQAYEAFLDYVGMGATRSISKLRTIYLQREGAIPTKQLKTLQEWSSKYRWQERVGLYLNELAKIQAEVQKEHLIAFTDHVWESYHRLAARVDEMIDRFEKERVVKRRRMPDPRDDSKEIEVVTLAPNTRDLQALVASFAQLGRGLQEQVRGGGQGGRISVEMPTASNMKAYITFNPDDWPDPGVTPNAPDDSNAE